jgi:hypothetical protein
MVKEISIGKDILNAAIGMEGTVYIWIDQRCPNCSAEP